MIKVIEHGKRGKTLRGTCIHCGCKVECLLEDTRTLVDRDSVDGAATQYVKCPECKTPHLWVS